MIFLIECAGILFIAMWCGRRMAHISEQQFSVAHIRMMRHKPSFVFQENYPETDSPSIRPPMRRKRTRRKLDKLRRLL